MLARVWVWRCPNLWMIVRCYGCHGEDVPVRWPQTSAFCRACGRLTLVEAPSLRADEEGVRTR